MTDQTPALPKPGQQLRGTARTTTAQQAADLYVQGCTIRSVAIQIGRSYGATRALLLEAGVQLRTRGGGIRKTVA
ncbi:helix-turn-helix domain-containing protein [Streptomyces sp. NPDC093065]|uniref:helix-turn-helix domain-containing protein n=1 Tax=Streptomyces sp. NPDC093065 TaxID=3366021 RepID=UPI003820C86A